MALREKAVTDPAARAGEISGFFSAALDRENFELYVEVKDAVHHPLPGKQPWEGDSVQFAFDGGGRGLTGDRIEFTLTLDREGRARLVKNFAAPVGGDLPGRYTAANEPMQTVTVAGERRNGRTVYRLRMPVSELYPLTIPQNGTVRFSLLVNNNDGNGRAYYRGVGERHRRREESDGIRRSYGVAESAQSAEGLPVPSVPGQSRPASCHAEERLSRRCRCDRRPGCCRGVGERGKSSAERLLPAHVPGARHGADRGGLLREQTADQPAETHCAEE
ncbi:MAG: hypothetical protein L6W00_03410 [Lentisphaeria bacterium]|nr:MAG: hypothetical protein L6W00_03410 [Lentisphaeria bacterium]